MMKNNKYLLTSILAAIAIGGPLGCGDDDGGGGAVENPGTGQEAGITNFNAVLRNVNGNIGGTRNPAGAANFSTANNVFTANVTAQGLVRNTLQMQHIHTGARCPTAADDTNRDGIIDAIEEAAASGQILIPLDNSLSKQEAMPQPPAGGAAPMVADGWEPQATPGASPAPSPTASPAPMPPMPAGYPIVDRNGSYTYTQTANIDQMLADLRAADPNPADSVAKLGTGGPLDLANRVIVIHGLPAETVLPATVRSIDGLPAHMTIPVACGELNPAAADDGAGGTPGGTPGASPTATPGASPVPPAPPATATPTPTSTPPATASPAAR